MSTEDRRAQGATRIPFEGLVEVGGAAGPSFEAQAVNVSEEGMQLRTAYLPEIGQPLTCRFDAGAGGQSVLASGEVVWTNQNGKGGEFGIRFADLDEEGAAALRQMMGAPGAPAQAPGAKVRLHIEGLASPMRARVKQAKSSSLVVGSDLGFLKLGKELDLEDAESGQKRPARIDGVAVDVDDASRVPQLVVKLRYSDVVEAAAASAAEAPAARDSAVDIDAGADADPPPPKRAASVPEADDLESVKKASSEVKGAMARGMAKIGPAFAGLASRAKGAFSTISQRRAGSEADAPQARRTTAPAPGGGLHASGRKVIRSEAANEGPAGPPKGAPNEEEASMPSRFKMTKRKAAVLGAAILAIALAVIALNKKGTPNPAMASPLPATADSARAAHSGPKLAEPPPAMNAAPAATAGQVPGAGSPTPGSPPVMAAESGGAAPPAIESESPKGPKDKHGKKVAPFGAPVAHPNVLTLKMDGPIERIQGAAQPTGFTVQIPGRKSVDAAGPLAQKDARIASIKVTNDGAGAELTLAFKDGVPKYQVRARGDVLEIALSPVGKGDKKVAKKDKGASKKGGGKKPGAKGDHPERQPHH